MTLTFRRDLWSVKLNPRDKRLGQKSFNSKVTIWKHRHLKHTRTHTPDRLLYLDHCTVVGKMFSFSRASFCIVDADLK